ncbi:heterokaryon incompatibility protein-domain-containing protein [Stachybotrys elegans]|uniref:Heterokaryon incompatibility protein-domain-containing protein n=1 Tax=Stachybotrys elegans TaxID=80388 RepID=A0A8K0SZL4_9HYPO|nr:heterokaryon incompatibility protein-domain-containing protein [Stachybotrys elegans]
MRLINVETLEVEEFFGQDVPQYAILSHTWLEGEISYEVWSEQPQVAKTKQGYSKIISMCETTKSLYGLKYAWVDTNCIDKRLSAELSEALNSMYKWYADAEVCIVYLADVDYTPTGENATGQHDQLPEETLQQFRSSRWFTRGWTLQELIAPKNLVFFSKEWNLIASRKELVREISQITGISDESCTEALAATSVAEKMHWASGRQTTRVEDIAYCLMGIFDVNMPLLYGEGTNAFVRLQEEILKTSNDRSILAWTMDNNSIRYVLAPSPRNFGTRLHYSMTNRGLRITARIYRSRDGELAQISQG